MKLLDFLRDTGKYICFFPNIARCFGRGASLFITQINWWTYDTGGWVQKTMEEIEEATTLSHKEQRSIRTRLIKMGVLEERVDKRNHLMYYQLDAQCINLIWGKWVNEHPEAGAPKASTQVPQSNLPGAPKALDARAHYARVRNTENNNTKNKYTQTASPLRVEGFFSSNENKLSKHQKWAKHLYEALKAKGKVDPASKPKRWPVHFEQIERTFLKEDPDATPRIITCLKWFVKHIGEKYVPIANNPYVFFRKFMQIESAMRRNLEEGSKPNLEVKPQDLEGVAKELYESQVGGSLHWPKGCLKQLPGVLKASVENYEKMWKKRSLVYNKLSSQAEEEEKNGEQGKAWEMIAFIDSAVNIIGGVKHDLTYHFTEVSEKVSGWENWNGDLTREVWSIDNKAWNKAGAAYSYEYSGTEKRWNDFIKLLKNEN